MSDDLDDSGTGGRRVLVAEYVLGLLDSRRHAQVERLIESDASLKAERDFWQSRFAALDAHFEPQTPPSGLFSAIESRLFGKAVSGSWWDSLAIWRGATAGALAVAVAAVGFNLVQPAPDSQVLATQLVAALEAEGSDIRFVAFYDGTGSVRLAALSGTPVPNSDFELWAIQGGQAPISMGVIPVDQRSSVALSEDVLAGWGEGSILAVTVEPEGGSPSGAPTGPIVAQGAITEI